MILIRQIKIPVLEDNKDILEKKIIDKLNIKKKDLLSYKINKKSIDARNKNNILYVYEVIVDTKTNHYKHSKDISIYKEQEYTFKLNKEIKDRPIIIGSGPAGLFCSYMLATVGLKPIIIERGEPIEKRIKTVEKFFKTNKLNKDSNIQFGEGGAGTFSDGKLNTLTKDKLGRNKKVFEIFVECGAPDEILYLNNPHIGTDILRKVIVNMRNKIIDMGGKFLYNSIVTDIKINNNRVTGVVINNEKEIKSTTVVLAIGHSARDTFKMLYDKGIEMKPKNFAVGVRVEHLKEMIDKSQYGSYSKYLPPATYKLTYQTKDNRGVYSFCMCPGGFVVNASSEEKRLVVNGMSNYKRNEVNSNSAIVVTVSPKDFGEDIFSGLEFQRELEEKAYKEGKTYIPVQLYKDFKDNVKTKELGTIIPNTKGEYNLSNLRKVLPDYISDSIIEAMPEFGKRIKGFDNPDTVMLGVETRTSSPIVIERNTNFTSSIDGLYPCGEGAGYAGGITTAAIDGVKVAEKIVSNDTNL